MKWPNIWGLLLRANGNHLLNIVKPQIFGHTLLKSIDIALRKFPQPYYDIEFVNFSLIAIMHNTKLKSRDLILHDERQNVIYYYLSLIFGKGLY